MTGYLLGEKRGKGLELADVALVKREQQLFDPFVGRVVECVEDRVHELVTRSEYNRQSVTLAVRKGFPLVAPILPTTPERTILTSSPKLYIVSPNRAEIPRSCARCKRSSGVRSVVGSMQAR